MDELERERKSEEILAYYGGMDNRGEQELIVALLRELQDVYGCITAGVIERAAAVTGVKPSFIRALVRMYPTSVSYTHLAVYKRQVKKASMNI